MFRNAGHEVLLQETKVKSSEMQRHAALCRHATTSRLRSEYEHSLNERLGHVPPHVTTFARFLAIERARADAVATTIGVRPATVRTWLRAWRQTQVHAVPGHLQTRLQTLASRSAANAPTFSIHAV